MVVSSVFMTAGCGAMAVAKVDNMGTLWAILVIASLGIGGIVVPGESIADFLKFFVFPRPATPPILTYHPSSPCSLSTFLSYYKFYGRKKNTWEDNNLIISVNFGAKN